MRRDGDSLNLRSRLGDPEVLGPCCAWIAQRLSSDAHESAQILVTAIDLDGRMGHTKA